MGMPVHTDLDSAFAAALEQVARAQETGLRTADGEPAADQLEQLRTELETERAVAAGRGTADPKWVRRVVRWVAEWTPETDLTLLAALGAIARAGGRPD